MMQRILREIQSVRQPVTLIDPLAVRTGIDRVHLEIALALHIHGSFRKTAEALNMKPSTVYRRVCELEFQLGAQVFERHRRRLVPTSSGRVFVQRTAELLESFYVLVEAVRRLSDGKVGEVVIGFYGPISHRALHDLLFESDPFHPDVRPRPMELAHDRLLVGLASRQIDLAIVRGNSGPFCGRAMPLWNEHLLVVLPRHHRLADQQRLHWADLSEEIFLVSAHDPSIHRLVIERLAPQCATPRIAIQAISTSAIMYCVEAGHGIGFCFESMADDRYPGTVVRELVGSSGSESVTSFACWREDHENPALSRLLQHLIRRYPPPNGGL